MSSIGAGHMQPRLSLYRNGLELRASIEPPLSSGVVSYHRGRGSVPLCIDIATRLFRHYGNLVIDGDASLALGQQRARLQLRMVDPAPLALDDSRLWSHQRSAIAWLTLVQRGILADEQGMGKTVSALLGVGVTAWVVVVCHSVKRDDWADHVKQWRQDEYCYVLQGDATDRARQLAEWGSTGGFLICNYDQMIMHVGDLASQTQALILDEAHKVRNRKSQWQKAASLVAKGDKRLIILTATPTINDPLDVWSLLHLVDPARFRSYWSFVYRFFDTSTNGFGIQIGGVKPHEQQALEDLIAPYMMARTREEVGGLGVPRTDRWIVYHEMTGIQRELYEDMRLNGVATYGEAIETWLPIQKITRLRQLAIDPAILFEQYWGPSKILTLLRVIKEAPQTQTLVFSMFEAAANRARDILCSNGISADVLSGAMSDRHRRDVLDAFTSGRVTVLCSTHGTGGEGLNLPNASRVIFLELAWHPAGNRQAQSRAVRPGQQADHVEVIVIHTRDSIEDHIAEIVRSKQKVTIDRLLERGAV